MLRSWRAAGRDLAVGAEGTVYLAGSHEIQRFAPDGTLLSKWGTSGSGDEQFGEVWGLDTSPSGQVYVADTYGNRIEVFSPDGTFVGKWGAGGSGPGQFIWPYGIAVNAGGEVYVADTVNSRIQKFSVSGVFLGAWGKFGEAPGRFRTPTAVTTDPAGYVYVADMGDAHGRVQKFSADGRFVTQWTVASPPPVRLFGTVGRRTRKRFATFHFSSRQAGLHFQCRLGGELVPAKLRRWRSCSSPQRYSHLLPGRKVFSVRGLSRGFVGRARRSWLIVG